MRGQGLIRMANTSCGNVASLVLVLVADLGGDTERHLAAGRTERAAEAAADAARAAQRNLPAARRAHVSLSSLQLDTLIHERPRVAQHRLVPLLVQLTWCHREE